MSPSRSAPAALLLAAAAAGAPAAPVAPPPREAAYYFPSAVGSKWVYEVRVFGELDSEYSEEVTAVWSFGRVTFVGVRRVEAGGKVTPTELVVVTLGRLARLRAGDDGATAAPFFVDRGSRVSELDGPSRYVRTVSPGAVTVTRTVGEAQRVTVPAGVFTAVPITASPRGGTAPTLEIRFDERSWYAPGVGLVKQTAGPKETVLKSFTPGKDAAP